MEPNQTDILLVEDSGDDAELAIHALRREHLANNIFVARDGEEGLDFLFCRGPFSARSFEHPPKLVLLDLKLPKVDGIEVLKQLKGDQRTKAIPVVVLTSSAKNWTCCAATNWGRTAISRSRWTSKNSGRR